MPITSIPIEFQQRQTKEHPPSYYKENINLIYVRNGSVVAGWDSDVFLLALHLRTAEVRAALITVVVVAAAFFPTAVVAAVS